MGLQAFIISHAPQLLAEPSEGMKILGAIINKKGLLMEQVLLLFGQKSGSTGLVHSLVLYKL